MTKCGNESNKILEMKMILIEIIISMVEFNSKSDTPEEWISKLDDRLKKLSKIGGIEISKTKSF